MTPQRTRDEHMAWCKQRALAYLDTPRPNPREAVTSMLSDLSKHPDTKGIGSAIGLYGILFCSGDEAAARRWIEGFR